MRTVRRHRDMVEYVAALGLRLITLENARRLGSSSIDNGELAVTSGDIVVKNGSGEDVTRIKSGDSPEIQMTPTQEVPQDYMLRIYGWESLTQGAALQLDVNRMVGGVPERDGGKLLLMRGGAYLSHQPTAEEESYYSAGAIGNGYLYMKGRFGQNTMVDDDAAVVCGSVAVAAGVSSYSHTYPMAASTTMVPVVQMVNTAGALGGCLTAMSTTGFTFAWTGTLAKTINYWSFRV